MFQKLNSMFMGDSSNILSHEPELSEKEGEDEWILVDLIVDACTGTSEEASTLEEIVFVDEHPVLSFTSGALKPFGNTSDSYFVHFDACPMEESWFVTPPPCFTAGELTTNEVETSPMENLLIEHPSMSVYAVHNLSNKQADTCDSEFDTSNSLRLDAELTNMGPMSIVMLLLLQLAPLSGPGQDIALHQAIKAAVGKKTSSEPEKP